MTITRSVAIGGGVGHALAAALAVALAAADDEEAAVDAAADATADATNCSAEPANAGMWLAANAKLGTSNGNARAHGDVGMRPGSVSGVAGRADTDDEADDEDGLRTRGRAGAAEAAAADAEGDDDEAAAEEALGEAAAPLATGSGGRADGFRGVLGRFREAGAVGGGIGDENGTEEGSAGAEVVGAQVAPALMGAAAAGRDDGVNAGRKDAAVNSNCSCCTAT